MKVICQFLRKNLYMVATSFILLLSVLFAGITMYALGARNNIDATSVGPIYLGNQNEEEFVGILEREIGIWANSAEYRILFQDYEYSLDLTQFVFDVLTTVQTLTRDTNNLAHFILPFAAQASIRTEMADLFTTAIADFIDYDQMISIVLADMGRLYQRKTYELGDFLATDLALTIIDSDSIDGLEMSDVTSIVESVSRITIGSNERFSLLKRLSGLPLSNEQLSIIASGIQSITIGTAFSNFDFESYYESPSWVENGKNVRILQINQYDFTFFNPFSHEYTIAISSLDSTSLQFDLIGYPFISGYQIEFTEAEVIPFKTFIIDDLSINAATPGVLITETATDFIYRLLVQSGIPGSVIFCERTETRIGVVPIIVRLFIEQIVPVDEIYRENIVSKGGD